jgi:hypothetical protein
MHILVATHKSYWMPEDPVYKPIHVGRALATAALPYQGDDQGDHISEKNKTFCELTALYWAWKQLPHAQAVGLCHYRRYFASTRWGEKRARIATAQAYQACLEKVPCLLPKARNYYIETNYSHYVHAHHAQDLRLTKAILEEKYPAYVPAWNAVMRSTKGHRFNMFVMRKALFDHYCAWLFDILFELEKRLDISTYSAYDQRVFGFVAERLLDVYLLTEKVPTMEMAMVHLESQHWPKKMMNFLLRKFGLKRA